LRYFRLLGELTILEGDAVSEIVRSEKGCALLAYLIYTGERKTREHMADLLWESESTGKSLTLLRHLLSRTVRSGAPDVFVERRHLSFVAEEGTTVDLYELEAGLQSGEIAEIDQALRLYKGAFLGAFFLKDAPYFNEWLTAAQELLRQRVMIAYHTVCGAYMADRLWRNAIDVAQRWLEQDPFNEDALRYLLRSLVADGRLGAAQQYYTLFRGQLWEEMALEPEEATIQLMAEIEAQRAEFETAVPLPVARPQAVLERPNLDELTAPGSLPPQSVLPYSRNKMFAGRHDELLQIGRFFFGNQSNGGAVPFVVAVTGMGGLGKSQLAVEFAYRYGRYFAGGVYWISFADPQEVAEQITEIGGANGMGLFLDTDNLTQSDKIGRITNAWQAPTPRLLIFDNCEDEALLSEWLPVSGGCSVILTSRKADWPQEIHLMEIALGYFAPAVSLRFLQQLVPNLTAADGGGIAEELGHLPLALHLSGHFLRRYGRISPAQYLHQLQSKELLDHPSLEGAGVAFSPTGHELSVARTFALSWDQLDLENEIDQLAVTALGAIVQFAPGEPIPQQLLIDLVLEKNRGDIWAEMRADDSLFRLHSLGFIRLSGASVTMHRLVVSFVQTACDDALLIKQHGAVAEALVQLTDQHRQARGVDLHTLPLASIHFRHVADTAVAQGSAEMVNLMWILGEHLTNVNLPEARRYLNPIIDLTEKRFGAESPQMIVALYAQASLCQYEGKLEEGKQFGRRAIDLEESFGGEQAIEIGRTYLLLSYITVRLDEVDLAYEYGRAALAIFKPIFGETSEYIGDSLRVIGNVLAVQGHFDEALTYFLQAIEIFRAQFGENYEKVGDAYNSIASAYAYRGKFERSKEYCLKALQVNEQIFGPDSFKVYGILTNLGVLAWRNEDFEGARYYFERVLGIAQEFFPPDHYNIAEASNNIAEVLCKMGHYDEAMDYHQNAYRIRCVAFGEEHFETMRSVSMMGEVWLRRGNAAKAVEILGVCESVQVEVETNVQAITDTQVLLGEGLQAMGDFDAAEAAFLRALAGREEGFGEGNTETVRVLLFLGQLFEVQGEMVRAQEMYEQGAARLGESGVVEHPLLGELEERLAGAR